jgi:nucleotide-binding universal stress UspA family protein
MNTPTIVVGVDLKGNSLKVCIEAIHYAFKLKSSITLVHVIEQEVYYPYFPYDEKKINELTRTEAKAKLQHLESYIKMHNIELTESIIEKGITYQVLCRVSDRLNTKAIIIGVGEHYLFEELIGSTTEKVSRMAAQKVIIVGYSNNKDFKNILSAFDFSANGIKALQSAIRFSHYFKAKLHILHVHDSNQNDDEIASYASATCEKIIHEELQELSVENINYDLVIKRGHTVMEILKCVEERDIQLLSIGSSGHSALTRLFLGSTVAKIIRKTPCSIVVTPK